MRENSGGVCAPRRGPPEGGCGLHGPLALTEAVPEEGRPCVQQARPWTRPAVEQLAKQAVKWVSG